MYHQISPLMSSSGVKLQLKINFFFQKWMKNVRILKFGDRSWFLTKISRPPGTSAPNEWELANLPVKLHVWVHQMPLQRNSILIHFSGVFEVFFTTILTLGRFTQSKNEILAKLIPLTEAATLVQVFCPGA